MEDEEEFDDMETVLVTGVSKGIGHEIANMFLEDNFDVIGFDIDENCDLRVLPDFHFYQVDVSDACGNVFPNLDSFHINYIINNAGIQTDNDTPSSYNYDIRVNLEGAINVCEKYAYQDNIKSVVNIASVSGHTGAEFPRYAASKGGLLTYTKALANDLSKYKATVNSISPGGVKTDLNRPVMNDEEKWSKIMEVTPLKKWCDAREVADLVYFLTIINKSITGQDIVIDNGEMIHSNFVW